MQAAHSPQMRRCPAIASMRVPSTSKSTAFVMARACHRRRAPNRDGYARTGPPNPALARRVRSARPRRASRVTSAAIAERSERVSVMWANSGCPFSVSMTLRDAVVAADAQVVALGDVVGQHHPRVLADAAEHGEQHVALERLRLVDDHERVVQRAAADVRERQHLEDARGRRPLRARCRETTEPSVSNTAWPHGFIFSPWSPGR